MRVEVVAPPVYKCAVTLQNLDTGQSIKVDWHDMQPPGGAARCSSNVLQMQPGHTLRCIVQVVKDSTALAGATVIFFSGDCGKTWGSPIDLWITKTTDGTGMAYADFKPNVTAGQKFTVCVLLRV